MQWSYKLEALGTVSPKQQLLERKPSSPFDSNLQQIFADYRSLLLEDVTDFAGSENSAECFKAELR